MGHRKACSLHPQVLMNQRTQRTLDEKGLTMPIDNLHLQQVASFVHLSVTAEGKQNTRENVKSIIGP